MFPFFFLFPSIFL
uniref:Uncharacterized protein n=1 Tax=Arundo donax TaxID=35708 RepID=A0A0A9G5A2_ARUDO